MFILNTPERDLLTQGALHTAREISSQPGLWQRTATALLSAPQTLDFYTESVRNCSSIILTGAGTSAFIGLSLQGALFTQTGLIARAVPTTDIVSHPHHYFNEREQPLVISFARSGNSPESVAALQLADRFSRKCRHLIITCSQDGELARYQSINPVHSFVLPPDSNDMSLAMTGSYSSMLLSGLLLAYSSQPAFCEDQLALVIASAKKILSDHSASLRRLADRNFERAVFLGSGPLFGTATEAALKLQELTDGRVICKADSYLGFRHGPKAVINETTLVMYFFNNISYVQRYEHDLVEAMKKGNQAMLQLGVSDGYAGSADLDLLIDFGIEGKTIAEDFLPLSSIVVGQLLAFFKSLQCGLMPDAPSVSGSISRIVEGVNIYPVGQ